jgi:hypothetical protein
MGSCLWDLSLGHRTGDGRFDGEVFLGGLLIFFLGGRGRGRGVTRGTPGYDCRGVFAGRHEFQTDLFMLYIIYCAVEVSLQHAPDNRERWSRSSMSWSDTCVVQAWTTRRPSPHIEDGEGAVTPRSTTDSTEQWV